MFYSDNLHRHAGLHFQTLAWDMRYWEQGNERMSACYRSHAQIYMHVTCKLGADAFVDLYIVWRMFLSYIVFQYNQALQLFC